jgi:hypothetical protein
MVAEATPRPARSRTMAPCMIEITVTTVWTRRELTEKWSDLSFAQTFVAVTQANLASLYHFLGRSFCL